MNVGTRVPGPGSRRISGFPEKSRLVRDGSEPKSSAMGPERLLRANESAVRSRKLNTSSTVSRSEPVSLLFERSSHSSAEMTAVISAIWNDGVVRTRTLRERSRYRSWGGSTAIVRSNCESSLRDAMRVRRVPTLRSFGSNELSLLRATESHSMLAGSSETLSTPCKRFAERSRMITDAAESFGWSSEFRAARSEYSLENRVTASMLRILLLEMSSSRSVSMMPL
eukprot:Amastigsp_a6216_11.p3 type:complete len:225 gc:universal Amastigsp_a6216_11:494-1168(+)